MTIVLVVILEIIFFDLHIFNKQYFKGNIFRSTFASCDAYFSSLTIPAIGEIP